jgi:hypothetical protein
MSDVTLAVPFTDDEQVLELTAGESIALRDHIAQRITFAGNELDGGIAYSGIRDGDGEALERAMVAIAVVSFYRRVLIDNLGFAPSLPDELLLDERGLDVVEAAAAYAEHELDEFGWTADPLDVHDWQTLVALGERIGGRIEQ